MIKKDAGTALKRVGLKFWMTVFQTMKRFGMTDVTFFVANCLQIKIGTLMFLMADRTAHFIRMRRRTDQLFGNPHQKG
jgi:hypothetical protein